MEFSRKINIFLGKSQRNCISYLPQQPPGCLLKIDHLVCNWLCFFWWEILSFLFTIQYPHYALFAHKNLLAADFSGFGTSSP